MKRTHKIIHTFPAGTRVVGIEKLNDVIYIAVEYGVYRIVNDQLIPLEIVWEE